MREAQTEVLVVGAGPVGLWSALLLAEAGLQVTIIDREERTTARSYACALHSSTLALLERLDLATEIVKRGRRIERVLFCDQTGPRAQLSLAALGGDFPFLLILPQSELEGVLEERLRGAGVKVQWNYRFADFADEPETVAVTIEELRGTGTGYIVPHWETVVHDRVSLQAQFIIGTDGQNSLVRQRLGIDFERLTGIDSFAAYEFESDRPLDEELRVVLGRTLDVLWPLPGNRCRWTYQVLRSEMSPDFPEKERRSARLVQPNVDERIRAYVQKVAQQRAPWFSAGVKEIAWCTEVSFEHRMVKEFGRKRCWLAGDAAHQTGPAGVQSMNAGFLEAERLTRIMRNFLRQQTGLANLAAYDHEQREQWRRLLGLTGGLKGRSDTDPWVRDNASRILSCLPASGPDVARLAAQLKLDFL
ncbi:MAG TPA: FAD-dependent oxidoreductase [Verrucomicrobiae bacterium]